METSGRGARWLVIVVGLLLHSPWGGSREGGREGKAQRSDPGVLTCGCCVVLGAAGRCSACFYEKTTMRNGNKEPDQLECRVPFIIHTHTVGQRNYFYTVLLGSAPFVEKKHTRTSGRGVTYRSTQRLSRFHARACFSPALAAIKRGSQEIWGWNGVVV